jgi:peptidoglycan/xylan/chitin deacetylase (PgdA/CDA1 family)
MTFRRQLQHVKESGIPVLTVAEWCSEPKPKCAVVFTFDDGSVSNYTFACPILQEFGFKATFFITVGSIGQSGTMNWTQIRALHGVGMEVGSHTLTHRPPTLLDDATLRYELSESRRILENGIGAAITSISSPTGFFNPRMRTLAQELGYQALCFGRVGLATAKGDPYFLKRIAVKQNTTESQFKALLRLDPVTIAALRLRQETRELARKILGPGLYLQLRRFVIGVRS